MAQSVQGDPIQEHQV